LLEATAFPGGRQPGEHATLWGMVFHRKRAPFSRNGTGAIEAFGKCLETDVKLLIEFNLAKAELKAMGRQVG